MFRLKRILAVLATRVAAPPLALGHGLLTYPAMRTAFEAGGNAHDCAHCRNAGGTWAQSGEGALAFADGYPSNAAHGLCGDLPGNTRNVHGNFPTTTVDVGGGTLRTRFTVTTNHWGKLCFYVFTNPDDVASGNEAAGIPLQRADGQGNCVFPPQVDKTDGDGMVYAGPATPADWLEGWGDNYDSLLHWPASLHCNGFCVLQSHWTTGHTCTPPGVPPHAVKLYDGWPAPPCEGSTALWPEQFWNCANFVPAAETVAVTLQLPPQPPLPPPEDVSAIAAYMQCGDDTAMPYGFSRCMHGLQCARQNDYYAQCLPPHEVPADWDVVY